MMEKIIKDTKEQVKEQVKIWMEEGIQSVVTGKEDRAHLLYSRPGDVITYLESLGAEYNNDFSTNGWQWDYNTYFTLEGKKYMLWGDGYYSASATFELAEDE